MSRGSDIPSKNNRGLDLGAARNYREDKVKKRIMMDDDKRGNFPRLELYGDLNDVLGGGLPYGLTTIYGQGGSGKSKLAGEIASSVAGKHGKVVYAAAEAITDVPDHDDVIGLDYTKNKPKYTKAVDELLGFCNDYEPHLLVIDSATKMFSKTDKAVEEADIRSALSTIEERTEGAMPALATSEVRGNPGWEYPAGGQAVNHACSMLIRMWRREASNQKEAEELGESIGSITWLMSIEKDRENQADTANMFKPVYTRRGLNLNTWESESDAN